MHPSRFALLRGPTITFAPEDDGYAEDWDDGPEAEEVDEPDEGEQEDPEVDDYVEPEIEDEIEAEPQRPQRKTFAQRVDERVAKEVAKQRQEFERELERRMPTQQPQRESPEQLRERIANMDQVQFAEWMLSQQQGQLQQIQFQAQDATDKAAYDTLASRAPIAAKLKDEVESRLADLRRQNLNSTRESVLKFLIGERALANASSATTRTRKTADANRQRQQARPTGGRSDTSRPATDSTAAARNKRLENMQL